uniref:hypothetical protein n=1 Tax=Candidatus Cryptobacteroides bacterium TaxID=3085639 RepID=UPI004028CC69
MPGLQLCQPCQLNRSANLPYCCPTILSLCRPASLADVVGIGWRSFGFRGCLEKMAASDLDHRAGEGFLELVVVAET